MRIKIDAPRSPRVLRARFEGSRGLLSREWVQTLDNDQQIGTYLRDGVHKPRVNQRAKLLGRGVNAQSHRDRAERGASGDGRGNRA
jgi:hypothetical protein